MKVLRLIAIVLFLAVRATASLEPVGPVPFSGTGLGSVNTILTIGERPVESGCVSRGAGVDVLGPPACPPGFVGGDERTGASQTQTRTIGELGLTTASDLRIVLNVNELTGNSAQLDDLALTIYTDAGTLLFTSGAFTPPTFPLIHSPGTTVGYVFELDDAQAAQAQLVFDPANRVGLAATASNATAGNETFFVADVTAIGTPIFGADIAVTKIAPATVIAGTDLTYSITVINNGPEVAANVTMTDVPPSSTSLVSVTAPAGWTCSAPDVTCTKPAMAAAESAVFSVVTRTCPEAQCGVVIVNTANGSSDTIDPVTDNGTSTATTGVQAQSDLAVTKAASAATMTAGGTITYTVNVTNAGPSNSAGTTIIDTLPAGFTATAVSTTTGTCSGAGTSTVSCNVGVLGTDDQCATTFPLAATITITAQVSPTAAAGTYTNTAAAGTTNCLADPVAANNSATAVTTVSTGTPPPPPPPTVVPAPTLSEIGVMVFAALLLLTGLALVRS